MTDYPIPGVTGPNWGQQLLDALRGELATEIGHTRAVLEWDPVTGWPARPHPTQLVEWLDPTGDAPPPAPAHVLPGDLYIPTK